MFKPLTFARSLEKVPIIFAAKPNFYAESLLIEAVQAKLRMHHPVHYVLLKTHKIKNLLLKEFFTKKGKERLGADTGLQAIGCAISAARTLISEFLRIFRKKKTQGGMMRSLFGLKYGKVTIGDCVLNTYLRTSGDTLKFNRRLIKTAFKIYYELTFFDKLLLSIEKNLSHPKKYFLLVETTYVDEAFRRMLLGKGFLELIQAPESGKLAILPGRPFGFQLVKSLYYPEKNPRKIRRDPAAQIEKYAKGVKNYDYILQKKLNKKIILNHSFQRSEKIGALFVHLVSDAQYLFGPSCFLDLHDWLHQSVAICRQNGISLILKSHPNASHVGSLYPLEKNYLERIYQEFGNPEPFQPKSVIPSKVAGVYWVHASLSTRTLVENFPGMLFLTHHGTIATEAAFFEQVCICSSAGPYPVEAPFLFQYRTLREYRFLVREWRHDRLRLPKHAKRALLSWAANRREYVNFKNNYFHLLLKNIGRTWKPYSAQAASDIIERKCKDRKTRQIFVDNLTNVL